MALESSLEKRVETVLREVLGARNIVVIVNAEMLSDAERKATEVMPGVPPKELSEAAAPLALAPTLVRKVTATVFLDQGMKEADQNLARKTVSRLLGLPPESGAVVIEPTVFRRLDPAAPAGPGGPGAPALSPEYRFVWMVPAAWLIFAAVALGLVYARFLTPLIGLAREVAAIAKERPARAEGNPELSKPSQAMGLPTAVPTQALEAPPPSRELEALTTHFGFIHERDLPALAFLLSRDPTSAAIVLNYLPPALGARFLDQLPTAVRQETAGMMAQTRLLNKHQVHMIEEGLRERLQYLMGGESRLAEILEGANVQVQTELLEALRERDPQTADRLSRRLVLLDDLALLDEGDFKALSRQVSVRSLATVLAASPDLKEQILPRLSGGVAEWLVQEVELCGSLPPDVVEAEQRRVLSALSRAVREGKIILRKEGVEMEEPLGSAPEPPNPPGLEGPPSTAGIQEMRPQPPYQA